MHVVDASHPEAEAQILAVDRVLAANAKQVEDYRAGKEKAFNSLVGQVMTRDVKYVYEDETIDDLARRECEEKR